LLLLYKQALFAFNPLYYFIPFFWLVSSCIVDTQLAAAVMNRD